MYIHTVATKCIWMLKQDLNINKYHCIILEIIEVTFILKQRFLSIVQEKNKTKNIIRICSFIR